MVEARVSTGPGFWHSPFILLFMAFRLNVAVDEAKGYSGPSRRSVVTRLRQGKKTDWSYGDQRHLQAPDCLHVQWRILGASSTVTSKGAVRLATLCLSREPMQLSYVLVHRLKPWHRIPCIATSWMPPCCLHIYRRAALKQRRQCSAGGFFQDKAERQHIPQSDQPLAVTLRLSKTQLQLKHSLAVFAVQLLQ